MAETIDHLSLDLTQMSEVRFVDGWAALTGSRPAAMLDDRRAMIAMLVQDAAILPMFPQHRAVLLASGPGPVTGERRSS